MRNGRNLALAFLAGMSVVLSFGLAPSRPQEKPVQSAEEKQKEEKQNDEQFGRTAHEYYLSGQLHADVARSRALRRAESDDGLTQYTTSDAFDRDRQALVEEIQQQWTPERFAEEWIRLDIAMREEAMWASFFDTVWVDAMRNGHRATKTKWDSINTAMLRGYIVGAGVWSTYRDMAEAKKDQPQELKQAMDVMYADARVRYPFLRAAREELALAILTQVYGLDPQSRAAQPWGWEVPAIPE